MHRLVEIAVIPCETRLEQWANPPVMSELARTLTSAFARLRSWIRDMPGK
jgi:hypothetical protein